MKFFVDTANIEEIKKAKELGIVDGVTTNPTLVSKEGKNFEKLIKEICKVVSGPVSVEAVSENYKDMIEEAKRYSKWANNIVIKIPMTEDGLKAVNILRKDDIRTNVTLIFSANQALLAAKAGASYVSPFIGRLDDISHDGMKLIKDVKEIFKAHNIKTEIIVASIRHPVHVIEAAKIGADIATIPFNVIGKMIKHPLTDAGIKSFMDDWKKVSK